MQRKLEKSILAADVISGAILLLMLYASISKLLDYNRFKAVLLQSPVIASGGKYIAVIIPSVELILSIFLFMHKTRPKALFYSLILVVIFTLYITIMVLTVSRPDLPCACGALFESIGWPYHILINLAIILLCILGLALYQNRRNLPARSPP